MSWINKVLGEYSRRTYKPVLYKEMVPWLYDLFKSRGEGIYYCNLKATNGNIVGKLIAKFSEFFNKKGQEDIPLSHCVIILYSEDLESCFLPTQWAVVKHKWDYFYGCSRVLDKSIKLLCLASADKQGMDFFDFSHYQFREFSLRKAPIDKMQQWSIIHFLLSISNKEYDFTGLFFWCLYRVCKLFNFLDDKDAYYCSEEIYEAFKMAGFKIADNDEPSPLDIENYRLDLRFFTTDSFFKK